MNNEIKLSNVDLILQNQTPSSIVFAPNYWQWFAHHKNHGILPDEIKHCQTQLDMINFLGLDVFSRNIYSRQDDYWFGGICEEYFDGIEVETSSFIENEDKITNKKYNSKAGILTEQLRYVFNESTVVQKEFLITDYMEQTGLLEQFVASRKWRFNKPAYTAIQQKVGHAGRVIAGEFFSPLKMLHLVMDPIQTVYFLMEKPEFAKSLLDLHENAQLDLVKQCVNGGVKVIMAMDNLDTMFHSPDYVENYSASFYEKASTICHAAGAKFFIHACGNQKENLPIIASCGVGTLESDWVQMENNVVRNCCWTNIYGSSNIGTLGAANFDSSVDNYRILIRNNISSGARSNFKCNVDGNYRITDGNGIIIDVNQNTSNRPTELYIGRTLVQNNVCFNNGGSGIHAVRADHVDIIGNTAYMNSASPELQYSPMYTYSSKDVKFINNIMVAPIANTSVGEIAEPVNQLKGPNNQVTFMNNLYFGGNIAPTMGSGDKLGDPKFINASIDPSVADFHLTSSSPAIASGATSEWMYNPRMDLDGKERRVGGKFPDIGAYCYSETKQQKITFNPLPNKAPTDADFTLTGSVSSGLEIIYSSTNQEVAKIIAGQIHIIGIGITIITATQPGNSVYAAASSICQSLVVTKDLETDPGQIPGSNLIYNSTFDTDLLGWGGYREGSTSTVNELIAKEGYSGNAAKITVTNGGTVNWYIQFSYPVAIEAQRKYSIQFKASADAPRIITFAFQENVGSKRTWFTNPNINITTIPTVYGPFYFNCTTTDNTDIFKFLIGNSNVSVFFDDVIITDVTNPTITSQLLAEMKPVLKIFPNPVSDKLTFETINYSGGKIRISLFDINGRLVLEKYQQNISDLKMTHEMNVSHLNQGVYLLKVNYANEQKTGMVVIKR
ncbi:MAG: T9SS type A sorting domain-containing protein [Mariniphaga sp.]|nr:T9SS type A sorting domain-containing protein [Mariniphaga sp.]